MGKPPNWDSIRILILPCPSCGEGTSYWCRSYSGQILQRFHTSRVDQALDAGLITEQARRHLAGVGRPKRG